MPEIVLPEPWSLFLADVDQSLSDVVELHCVGGFVLTVVHGIPRTAADIDYISAVPHQSTENIDRIAGRNSQLALKHKVFLQAVGGVRDYPENYESRLATLPLGLTRLTLRILEPYDLLLSKLTRNSPKDMQDVRALVQKLSLNFEVLKNRFQAEMSWVPNRERHEQTLDEFWKDNFTTP